VLLAMNRKMIVFIDHHDGDAVEIDVAQPFAPLQRHAVVVRHLPIERPQLQAPQPDYGGRTAVPILELPDRATYDVDYVNGPASARARPAPVTTKLIIQH
jgi:hypothetical protein